MIIFGIKNAVRYFKAGMGSQVPIYQRAPILIKQNRTMTINRGSDIEVSNYMGTFMIKMKSA